MRERHFQAEATQSAWAELGSSGGWFEMLEHESTGQIELIPLNLSGEDLVLMVSTEQQGLLDGGLVVDPFGRAATITSGSDPEEGRVANEPALVVACELVEQHRRRLVADAWADGVARACLWGADALYALGTPQSTLHAQRWHASAVALRAGSPAGQVLGWELAANGRSPEGLAEVIHGALHVRVAR